jgi:hypothetical protein
MINFLFKECSYLSVLFKYYFYSLCFVKDLKKIKRPQRNFSFPLFCTLKNEGHRIPFFLDYYRSLGVDQFFFIDNESSDGFLNIIKNEHDVCVYSSSGSYKDSNFGMHWINFLLWKYARGKWSIICDPDEFIVFPYMDKRSLKNLTSYLDSIKQESFFTPLVDMYSDKDISETVYTPGQNPLDVCPYFDDVPYKVQKDFRYKNLFLQGGVRRRFFSSSNPSSAPALNKVCLVKWRWYFAYIESMHMAIPKRVNICYKENHTTGAMLHFKFISALQDKVEQELVNKQHYNDSAEYKVYGNVIKEKQILYAEGISKKYEGWESLYESGFISKGEW